MADNVNHPAHYETGKFECIDVMVETHPGSRSHAGLLRVQRSQVRLQAQKEKWHGGFTESNLVSEQSR